MGEKSYSEIQSTYWFIYLIPTIITLYLIYVFVDMAFLGESAGADPTTETAVMLIAVLPLLITILLFIAKLRTVYTREGVDINLSPITSRSVKWEDVESAEIIRYNFVGYGYRLRTQYGNVYNMKGNIGLSIQLKDGTQLLVGVKEEDQLSAFLKEIEVL